MLDALTRGERYLFVIAVIIALGVYYGGFATLIKATGPQVNTLLVTGQGRTSTGQYPTYAANQPFTG
jgi:hypothetical protein